MQTPSSSPAWAASAGTQSHTSAPRPDEHVVSCPRLPLEAALSRGVFQGARRRGRRPRRRGRRSARASFGSRALPRCSPRQPCASAKVPAAAHHKGGEGCVRSCASHAIMGVRLMQVAVLERKCPCVQGTGNSHTMPGKGGCLASLPEASGTSR